MPRRGTRIQDHWLDSTAYVSAAEREAEALDEYLAQVVERGEGLDPADVALVARSVRRLRRELTDLLRSFADIMRRSA